MFNSVSHCRWQAASTGWVRIRMRYRLCATVCCGAHSDNMVNRWYRSHGLDGFCAKIIVCIVCAAYTRFLPSPSSPLPLQNPSCACQNHIPWMIPTHLHSYTVCSYVYSLAPSALSHGRENNNARTTWSLSSFYSVSRLPYASVAGIFFSAMHVLIQFP